MLTADDIQDSQFALEHLCCLLRDKERHQGDSYLPHFFHAKHWNTITWDKKLPTYIENNKLSICFQVHSSERGLKEGNVSEILSLHQSPLVAALGTIPRSSEALPELNLYYVPSYF